MRFSITKAQTSAVIIPAGTRVTGKSGYDKLWWSTEADISIPAGSLYADGKAVCMTEGVAGNGIAAGKLDEPVDLWDYMAGCQNITVTDGGTDAATDEEFYELMRQSMEAFSVAGPRGAYKYHAMQVSTELADVLAVNPKKDEEGNQIDGAGLVEIYAIGTDGNAASETMKAAILEACSADDVRPLTDHVSVKDPEAVEYAINLTYWLPRNSEQGGAAIIAAVNEAIENFKAWQAAKIGRDINPSVLIGMLMDCGIKRCAVTSPVFTELSDGSFADPEDYRKPEYAVCTGTTVTNGGVEDE
jgi:phage-related baseplate assembly protein